MKRIKAIYTVELYQLETFLRVAATGSITRAAETVHLTQPAVTHQIQALERSLGTPLFDRTSRGMQLTVAGDTLRDYAQRTLGLLQEARQVLTDLTSGAAGRLVVGAGVTTSIFRLPNWLRLYGGEFPGVEVVVRTGTSQEVAAMALARDIDMGLVTSPIQHPQLHVRPLFEEEILLVAPPDQPLTAGRITQGKLEAVPMLLFPSNSGFRQYLDRILAQAGITIRVAMETDSVEVIKSFVGVGLGLSFLPASAAEADIASGTLKRLTTPALPPLNRTTSLIYRADRHMTTAARGFLRTLVPE